MDNSTLISQDRRETSDSVHSEYDRKEQLKKNQKAMQLLKAMIDRNKQKKTTQADLEFWRLVYETIDRSRPTGQKLFSEE